MSSDFEDIFHFSSDTSDSESLLEEEVNSSENQINKEWEAIERTLYQEPGEQVTDPALLKECKLWRDTFPHFRVKGTKIDVEGNVEENEKDIQTLENHFNLKKLEEKRKIIKDKVVGELVERIITKFSLNKDDFGEDKKSTGVQITEIHEKPTTDKSSKTPPNTSEMEAVTSKPEKESYFERGKQTGENLVVTKTEMEQGLHNIFDSWEKEIGLTGSKSSAKTAGIPKDRAKTQKKSSNADPIGLQCLDKPSGGRSKFIPPSDSLSQLVKPFEMTKKIDKKYEGLLDKIMERKYNEMNPVRHCRKINSGVELRSYEESLDKLRATSGFDGYLGKSKNLPKINKFRNNWLERGEMNFNVLEEDCARKSKNPRSNSKVSRDLNVFDGAGSQNEIDDKFIEDLKKEMLLSYKRPPRRSRGIEGMDLRRPRLTFKGKPERTPKTSSCGDLPKKEKKDVKNRHAGKVGPENGRKEPAGKIRAKSTNLSRGGKNVLLPPIESGIICTELTGRPKIGTKNPSKKNF